MLIYLYFRIGELRALALTRSQLAEQGIEIAGGEGGADVQEQFAGGGIEKGLGQGIGCLAEAEALEQARGGEGDGQPQIVLLEEGSDGVPAGFSGGDGEEIHPGGEGGEFRQFRAAGGTPGGPEVDQQGTAITRGEGNGTLIAGQCDRGCGKQKIPTRHES